MDQRYQLGHSWRTGQFETGLTFDDMLMVPVHSSIESRALCDLRARLSKNITLNIPLVSSPMDTVTESEMAIGMAKQGGLGILHRFMSVEDQVEMVKKVKRTESFINHKPYLVGVNYTMQKVHNLVKQFNVKTFLVTDDDILSEEYNLNTQEYNQIIQVKDLLKSPKRKPSGNASEMRDIKFPLRGILTNRDIKSSKSLNDLVKNIMTPFEKMIVHQGPELPTKDKVFELMLNNKIEKMPVVEKNFIVCLIHLKDIEVGSRNTKPVKDVMGQFLVGAAIGAKEEDIERASKLVNSGCDVLVLDVANGHSDVCINALIKLKDAFIDRDVDIIAGSVATGEGAKQLIKAGADGIRCGIGNGSICITRVVSGCGVPQFTALLDVAPVCKEYGVPLMSDGGNKNSGNMCKALAVGADCIMLGRLVAGCDEGPSKVIYRDGKLQKVYRGMAGYGANVSKAQRQGTVEPTSTAFTPEGVEGYIPYAGPLENVLSQFTKGIQSGMSYCGANTIQQLQQNVRFIRMTQHGFAESGVHDITKM